MMCISKLSNQLVVISVNRNTGIFHKKQKSTKSFMQINKKIKLYKLPHQRASRVYLYVDELCDWKNTTNKSNVEVKIFSRNFHFKFQLLESFSPELCGVLLCIILKFKYTRFHIKEFPSTQLEEKKQLFMLTKQFRLELYFTPKEICLK